jgi:DNA-binding Lrp family transcriptional regulator
VQRLILDKTDQKILTLLARNGRLSYRNIANRMGLTTKSVKLRVDKMISGKMIKRFNACANPSIIDYKAMYIVILREDKLNKVEQRPD